MFCQVTERYFYFTSDISIGTSCKSHNCDVLCTFCLCLVFVDRGGSWTPTKTSITVRFLMRVQLCLCRYFKAILKEKLFHTCTLYFQAYLNGMYGENYVWIVTSIPDINSTSNWWVPEPSSNLACTRSQMEEALDHHFTFYYKNQIKGTLVSGKVLFVSFVTV